MKRERFGSFRHGAGLLLCASLLLNVCGWQEDTASESGDMGIQPLSVTLDASDVKGDRKVRRGA